MNSIRIPGTFVMYLLSVLSGTLLWLSWPEAGFTPLIFIAFIPLLLVNHFHIHYIRKRPGLKVFSHIYITMLVWNALTTWWIYNSTSVGSFFAIALNSLFMAVVWQLFFFTKKRFGIGIGYPALIFFWIAFEYLHLNWQISWPWLTLGNVFASRPEYVQWYEYTGVLGGSLWILFANLFLYGVAKSIFIHDRLPVIRKLNTIITFLLTAFLISLPVLISLWLYQRHSDRGTPVQVGIVQPNIDPYHEKFNGTGSEQLIKMLRLASTVTEDKLTLLVFPETALPDGLWEDQLQQHKQINLLRRFAQAFPQLTIIIGASTYKAYQPGEKLPASARKFVDSDNYYDAFNTALLIDTGNTIQVYHKSRLVPGVEKMPYPFLFGFLEKFAIDLGGISGTLGSQTERTVFESNNGLKIAPAICYESVYGDFLRGYIKNGAQLISVITNDGWWGNTPGYRQHLNYARLRAIEFRKSVVRSANTGVSAIINQRGDIVQQTAWWTEDAISNRILINDIKTFYSRHGDYIGLLSCLGAGVLFLLIIVDRFRKWRNTSVQ